MCKSKEVPAVVPTPVHALPMMGCDCTCTGCNFYEVADNQEDLINLTSLKGQGSSEFCSKDKWNTKYQLTCRSYVDNLRNCCGGADDASSSIMVMLSIVCLVLLFVICYLIIRKNKEIASLKCSLNKQSGENKDNVDK